MTACGTIKSLLKAVVYIGLFAMLYCKFGPPRGLPARSAAYVSVVNVLRFVVPFTSVGYPGDFDAHANPEKLDAYRRMELRLAEAVPEPSIEVAHVLQQRIADVPCHVIVPKLEGEADKSPVSAIVYLHGGGWTVGTHLAGPKKTLYRLAADTNSIVITVDYRLAPEHPFPAGLHDCFNVTRWVVHQGAILGIDTSRVMVAGYSAGGNLATAVQLMAQETGDEQMLASVRGIMLVSPGTDLTLSSPSIASLGHDYVLTQRMMVWFRNNYVPDPKMWMHPLVSPVYASEEALANLPPALIITAGRDPLRDEGETLLNRIRDAGGEAKGTRLTNTIHTFFQLPWGDNSDLARDKMVEFANEKLAVKDDEAEAEAAETEPAETETETETEVHQTKSEL